MSNHEKEYWKFAYIIYTLAFACLSSNIKLYSQCALSASCTNTGSEGFGQLIHTNNLFFIDDEYMYELIDQEFKIISSVSGRMTYNYNDSIFFLKDHRFSIFSCPKSKWTHLHIPDSLGIILKYQVHHGVFYVLNTNRQLFTYDLNTKVVSRINYPFQGILDFRVTSNYIYLVKDLTQIYFSPNTNYNWAELDNPNQTKGFILDISHHNNFLHIGQESSISIFDEINKKWYSKNVGYSNNSNKFYFHPSGFHAIHDSIYSFEYSDLKWKTISKIHPHHVTSVNTYDSSTYFTRYHEGVYAMKSIEDDISYVHGTGGGYMTQISSFDSITTLIKPEGITILYNDMSCEHHISSFNDDRVSSATPFEDKLYYVKYPSSFLYIVDLNSNTLDSIAFKYDDQPILPVHLESFDGSIYIFDGLYTFRYSPKDESLIRVPFATNVRFKIAKDDELLASTDGGSITIFDGLNHQTAFTSYDILEISAQGGIIWAIVSENGNPTLAEYNFDEKDWVLRSQSNNLISTLSNEIEFSYLGQIENSPAFFLLGKGIYLLKDTTLTELCKIDHGTVSVFNNRLLLHADSTYIYTDHVLTSTDDPELPDYQSCCDEMRSMLFSGDKKFPGQVFIYSMDGTLMTHGTGSALEMILPQSSNSKSKFFIVSVLSEECSCSFKYSRLD